MNKIKAAVASTVLAGASIAGMAMAATGASAATVQSASVMSAKLPTPADQLTLTYQGKQYTYNVKLHETWIAPGFKVVSGTLRDTYEPQPINLPVYGVDFNGDAVLSVQYPATGVDAGPQGLRTFVGNVGPHGSVTGTYSETGSEAASGPFSLDRI